MRQDDGRPLLRVVKGDPTDEELAALVAVVAARASAAAAPSAVRRSAWADPGRRLHGSLAVGPDGWRRSAYPR